MDFPCRNLGCGKLLHDTGLPAGTRINCPAYGEVQTVPGSPEAIMEVQDPAQKGPTYLSATEPEPGEDIVDVLPATTGVLDTGGSAPRRARRRYHKAEFLCPFCEGTVFLSTLECPRCYHRLTDFDLEEEQMRLKKQRARFQMLSFVFGLPGLGLSIAGLIIAGLAAEAGPAGAAQIWSSLALALLLNLSGFLLLGVGIVYATLYKRFNAIWALLGLSWGAGLFILMVLPDEKLKRLFRISLIQKGRTRGATDKGRQHVRFEGPL